jgi:hypothetical protein
MWVRRSSHAFTAVVCLLVLLLEGHNAQPGDIAAAVPSVTTAVVTAPSTPACSRISTCTRLPDGDRGACEAYYTSLRGTGGAGVLYASLTWQNDYPASCKQLPGGGGGTMQNELQRWQPPPASMG